MGNYCCCKDNTEKITEKNKEKNDYLKLNSLISSDRNIRYIYIDSLDDL